MIQTDRRGVGRTRAMVMALPESGAIVVVHSQRFIQYVRQMVRDLRGPDIERRCRFVSVGSLYPDVVGIEMPLRVDHFVWEHGPKTDYLIMSRLHEAVAAHARYERR